jgi:ABC-type transport system substrate-binding protein
VDRAESIATAPAGTGPFRLVDFRSGDQTRLAKFKDYWDKGLPHLDELWQINMPRPRAVASLAGGEMHVMFEVPTVFVPTLERNPAVTLVEVKSPGFQPVSMMTTQKPFSDNRVRQAMKHLVDREAIIKAIWQGRGEIGEDHRVPKFHPFYGSQRRSWY